LPNELHCYDVLDFIKGEREREKNEWAVKNVFPREKNGYSRKRMASFKQSVAMIISK
jgi:hypothetical protein